jgi:hypothetical protein
MQYHAGSWCSCQAYLCTRPPVVPQRFGQEAGDVLPASIRRVPCRRKLAHARVYEREAGAPLTPLLETRGVAPPLNGLPLDTALGQHAAALFQSSEDEEVFDAEMHGEPIAITRTRAALFNVLPVPAHIV